MVYIVSHTWQDRFTKRTRATVEVYSNCDSVKLYNDATNDNYMGKKKNNGRGSHFMWENRDVRYDVLRAVGYFEGKPVAEDAIVLNNLEKAPHFEALNVDAKLLLKAEPNYNYLYRINCGGDNYTDEFNQQWAKDDSTISRSWAADFNGLNPYLASQGVTNDPIRGTRDWSLFGHFRFGRHKLNYHFAVPEGIYRVELYFTEPWHGTGSGVGTDCEGLRIFDVAVNDSVVLNDLDIWAESGHDGALKKVVYATIKGGKLDISFPEVKAGQAVISAIAIASANMSLKPVVPTETTWSWSAADKNVLEKTPKEMLPEDKNVRISTAYEAEKAILKGKFEKISVKTKVGIRFGKGLGSSVQWTVSTGLAQIYALRFNYMNTSGKPVKARLQMIAANGTVLKNDEITFPDTVEKWKQISTTTGTFINAGTYRVIISGENLNGLGFDSLEVQ